MTDITQGLDSATGFLDSFPHPQAASAGKHLNPSTPTMFFFLDPQQALKVTTRQADKVLCTLVFSRPCAQVMGNFVPKLSPRPAETCK